MGTSKLFTVLGNRQYDEAQYSLKGKTSSKVKCAPLALLELINWDGGVKVVTFLTDEAERIHKSYLSKELEKKGHELVIVKIPFGANEEELWTIFRSITENVEQQDQVAVDVTHGFRSLPILMVAALLFLKEAKDLKLTGLFYGALEAGPREDSPKPIFELTRLIDIVEWAHAVRIFRRYGHFDHIGRILARIQDEIQKQGLSLERPQMLKKLGMALEKISLLLYQGLSLELGKAAYELKNIDLERVREEVEKFAPPAGLLLHDLVKDFVKMAGYWEGRGWKAKIALDSQELDREAKVVDWYLNQGQSTLAVALIRELMVNRIILAMRNQKNWLKYNEVRAPAERALNLLAFKRKHRVEMNEVHKLLAGWWLSVSDKRNSIAHCGFKENLISLRHQDIVELWSQIKEKLYDDSYWNIALCHLGKGVALLSPLGLSKGLLYSAICRVNPNKVVVVTSEDAKKAMPEILKKAGRSEKDVYDLVMKDPHAGFEEAEKLCEEAIPHLLEAERVVANLTGGTTAMQFVVQRISSELERQHVPVKEVALVDRRSPDDQRREPYHVGEIVSLNPRPYNPFEF